VVTRRETKPTDDLDDELRVLNEVTSRSGGELRRIPGPPTREESEADYREKFGRYRPFQVRGSAISWVEFETVEPWTVTFGFTAREGALELAEVHIFPTRDDQTERGWNFLHRGRAAGDWSRDVSLVPPGGLTSRAVREMTGNLNEALRVALDAVPPTDSYLATVGFVTADRRTNRPPAARPRHADDKLALVSVFYGRAVRDGNATARYVAEQLTARGFRCAPNSVPNLVSAARDRGFLTKSSKQGRASGQATEKAESVAQMWFEATAESLTSGGATIRMLPDVE
jgi:hypothetical protein